MNSSASDNSSSSDSGASIFRRNRAIQRPNPRYNFLSNSMISNFTGRNRSIQDYNDSSPILENRNPVRADRQPNRQQMAASTNFPRQNSTTLGQVFDRMVNATSIKQPNNFSRYNQRNRSQNIFSFRSTSHAIAEIQNNKDKKLKMPKQVTDQAKLISKEKPKTFHQLSIPNQGGYDVERIMEGQMSQELKDQLICGICLELLVDPMECDNCRRLFCKGCISQWSKNCPIQCPGDQRMRPASHILKEFIANLQIKCEICNELVLFSKIRAHEEWCKKDKCANKQCQMILEFRSRKEFLLDDVKVQVCDDVCYHMFQLEQAMEKGDKNEILNFFNQYFQEEEQLEIQDFQDSFEQLEKMRSDLLGQQFNSSFVQRQIIGVLITDFKWDTDKLNCLDQQSKKFKKLQQSISISQDRRQIFLNEDEYIFRNFFGDVPLYEGIHYWEIIADARTEHELKVGVSSIKDIDDYQDPQCQYSFSDVETGWAFFGIGQVRHNSNKVGMEYGRSFKKQGVLGVFLNMNKGTLEFAIDSQYQGVAFQDEKLKKGPLYPAVSFLHKAGCILVSGKYPPKCFYE